MFLLYGTWYNCDVLLCRVCNEVCSAALVLSRFVVCVVRGGDVLVYDVEDNMHELGAPSINDGEVHHVFRVQVLGFISEPICNVIVLFVGVRGDAFPDMFGGGVAFDFGDADRCSAFLVDDFDEKGP